MYVGRNLNAQCLDELLLMNILQHSLHQAINSKISTISYQLEMMGVNNFEEKIPSTKYLLFAS